TLAMAGLMAAATAVALPASARAADVAVFGRVLFVDHDDARYRADSHGTGPAFRHGYDRGWRDGSDEGGNDGRHNHDPRFWEEGRYRDGDHGYKGWMGPKWDYANGYRDGYAAGYRRAYASARPGWRDRDDYRRWRYPYDRDDHDR
ncbi:MAG TPA: hypothetical protein VEQ10_05705, partial [Vicinamibacteria bacterium]|nr:hypothetical protein [Vicinamibacteria bacterium]